MEEDNKLAEILAEAHRCYETFHKNGGSPGFIEYEHFKKMLLENGLYGHEQELASILKI